MDEAHEALYKAMSSDDFYRGYAPNGYHPITGAIIPDYGSGWIEPGQPAPPVPTITEGQREADRYIHGPGEDYLALLYDNVGHSDDDVDVD